MSDWTYDVPKKARRTSLQIQQDAIEKITLPLSIATMNLWYELVVLAKIKLDVQVTKQEVTIPAHEEIWGTVPERTSTFEESDLLINNADRERLLPEQIARLKLARVAIQPFLKGWTDAMFSQIELDWFEYENKNLGNGFFMWRHNEGEEFNERFIAAKNNASACRKMADAPNFAKYMMQVQGGFYAMQKLYQSFKAEKAKTNVNN